MIDIHIIKSDRPYFKECLNSIRSDVVNVHLTEHIEGNIGLARATGFSKGNSPYVAAIDDDDIVVPEVFNRALEAMNKGYSAYYSNHYVMNENGVVYGKWFSSLASGKGYSQEIQMHHVVVYRRDVIEPLFPLMDGVAKREKILFNLASILNGKVFGDDFLGLYWRVGRNGNHKRRDYVGPESYLSAIKKYQYNILKRMKHDGINRPTS